MKLILISCLCLFCILTGFFIGRLTYNMNSEVISIDKPLYIMTQEKYGICKIPPETKLFYVRPIQEGGDIYKVYLYYKGKPLKTKPSKYRFDMDCMSVYFK